MGVKFLLNGKRVESMSPSDKCLLDVLRDEFHLYGVKKGCEEGECGACTILLDEKNVHACMLLLGEVEESSIITVEGLAKDGELDNLQKAFAACGAVQCGFCTPGMLLSLKALLIKNPCPTREEILEGIDGNICRCTGYEQIVEAVQYALKMESSHE